MNKSVRISFFFFFNDTATTEIYTLSLHDALPISWRPSQADCPARRRHDQRRSDPGRPLGPARRGAGAGCPRGYAGDRKSTRLNSSHSQISYAVFCLKKKKNNIEIVRTCTSVYVEC